MKHYRCTMCGHLFTEAEVTRNADGSFNCPACGAPMELIEDLGEGEACVPTPAEMPAAMAAAMASSPLAYPKEFARSDEGCRYMAEIHQMAMTGETIVESMGVKRVSPNWDDVLILGAQLDPMPLEADVPVDVTAVIGKNAKKPLVLRHPVYVSHMSFGALSREAKTALAKGSAMAGAAICSGEGGILPEEMAAAHQYIFEYVPNKYSVTDENLQKADAVEIKIGQGTKPGLGGQLPGDKVTGEIAAVRAKPVGQAVHSPSKFPGIDTKEDLKALVDELREKSGGRPVGIKLAAGRIEKDLAFCEFAGADFVTLDGRGGATGASPQLVRDATSVPTLYALHRARKYLSSVGSQMALVITGGLRVSGDFAKAIAMGADAVAVASAALMAMACQQYRLCGTGQCPMGVATQDPALRARLEVDAAAQRVANFFKVSLADLETFARLTGHARLHDLSTEDLCTTSSEVAQYTSIQHA